MSAPPLFVIPARQSGLARSLAHLAACQLPVPDLPGTAPVEQLAARNIEAAQRMQPHGPYRLMGEGAGGLVAYEMASQLIGRDEVVEFLAVVDCDLSPGELYYPHPLPLHVHGFERVAAGEIAARIELALAAHLPHTHVPEAEYSPMMTLQLGAARVPPIFLFPGAGASVTSFMQLITALGTATPVYGLQPRGLGAALVPHSTVEAAAAAYLREIRRVCPDGPYFLAGHSFGGWVVLEVALRLLDAGATVVDPIVLIDSGAPASASDESRHWTPVDALVKLIALLEEASEKDMNLVRADLEPLDHDVRLARLTDGMKAIGVMPRSGSVQSVRELVRVFTVNMNTHYVPRARFPGKVLLIQAAEPSVATDCDDDLDAAGTRAAWREHVALLESLELPGKHMTLLKRPNVDAIATLLRDRWSGVRDSAGPSRNRFGVPQAKVGNR